MDVRTIKTDILIIGAGPAGLTAGIYAARSGRRTMILEGRTPSRLGLGYEIENYPGFPSINSLELRDRFRSHAVSVGAVMEAGEAVAFALDGDPKFVTTKDAFLEAPAVVIATGKPFTRDRMIPGEERLTGYGVSYCATCDGPLYRNREVVALGGTVEALDEVLLLAQMDVRVRWIPGGRPGPEREVLIARARERGVEVHLDARVREIGGEHQVERVTLEMAGEEREIPAAGIFIFREIPAVSLFARAGLALDHKQCIAVDRFQKTNLPGVFAAGDVTCGGMQIVAACGEGCVAAMQALAYLRR